MLEFFHSLPVPTIWAGISFVIGVGLTGIAYSIVLKRYGPLQSKVLEGLSKANDKLVETQEKQLAMLERTLQMQKDHYEQEATETKERYERELVEAKNEWQSCRTTLHEERKVWNAESLKMQLLIKDLEGRPDMRMLNTTLEKVAGLIQTVGDNLEKHDKSIDARMSAFVKEVKKPRK